MVRVPAKERIRQGYYYLLISQSWVFRQTRQRRGGVVSVALVLLLLVLYPRGRANDDPDTPFLRTRLIKILYNIADVTG